MFRVLSRPALVVAAVAVTPFFHPRIYSEIQQVLVDSSLSPFPSEIKKSKQFHNDFKLLGHGVRSVTFVSFKVYGIGLYIAEKDIPKASKILTSLGNNLDDPKQSAEAVGKLLDNDVEFLARISPVRNTDFNHLKDGLIKSILAHPRSKELKEELAPGLEQLRQAFTRKGSVPKNHLLCLEMFDGGKLAVSYVNPGKEVDVMGVVDSPLISRQLFLQYLSGAKPLSKPLKDSCVQGFINL